MSRFISPLSILSARHLSTSLGAPQRVSLPLDYIETAYGAQLPYDFALELQVIRKWEEEIAQRKREKEEDERARSAPPVDLLTSPPRAVIPSKPAPVPSQPSYPPPQPSQSSYSSATIQPQQQAYSAYARPVQTGSQYTPDQAFIYGDMISRGYPPSVVTQALEFFAASKDQIPVFCENFTALKSMGFSDAQINEALLLRENNQQKALSYLLDGQ